MKRPLLISQTRTAETPQLVPYGKTFKNEEGIENWFVGFDKNVTPRYVLGKKEPEFFEVYADVYVSELGLDLITQMREHAIKPWKEKVEYFRNNNITLKTKLEEQKVDNGLTMRDSLTLYAVGLATGVLAAYAYVNWF